MSSPYRERVNYFTKENGYLATAAVCGLFAVVAAIANGSGYDKKAEKSVQTAQSVDIRQHQKLEKGIAVSLVPGIVVVDKNVRQRALPTRVSFSSVGTERGEKFVMERPMLVEHKDTATESTGSDQATRYLVGFAKDAFGYENVLSYVSVAKSTEDHIKLYTNSNVSVDPSVCADSARGLETLSLKSDGITGATYDTGLGEVNVGLIHTPTVNDGQIEQDLNDRGYVLRGSICQD